MTYELDFFEEFIRKESISVRSTSQGIMPEFTERKNLIQEEVERIKRSFQLFLFNTECEIRIENVIQHHQAQIISLANQIIKCIDKVEAPRKDQVSDEQTKANLCKVIYESLEELLTFFETYFSKYFNQDEKIPSTYAQMARKEIIENLKLIEAEAKEKELDSTLLNILLYPAKDFVDDPSKRNVTFRRLIYLKQLTRDLIMILRKQTKATYTDDVCLHLFYLNFNSYYFLTYTTDKISNEVRELTTLVDQVERLSFWIKLLNQNQVKPGFALKTERLSIQEQLGIWLSEEIHFIEKKKQLTFMMPPSMPLAKTESFKVNTILSVPQLAYLIRLSKEAGLITNQNQTELLRFFAEHFSSAKNKNVSSESLRVKYYSVERSSVRSVETILERMVAYSKKEIR